MTRRKPTETRREEIADAALAVIAEQGLGRFTTQAIAARIGVTDGSLFRHFANKEEIVLAAIDRAEALLFEGFPPADPDPLERLHRFFVHRAGLVSAQPVIARLAFSEELPHAAGPRGAERVLAWKRRSIEFIAGCLAEAAARGRLRDDAPPQTLAFVVLGSLMALVRVGAAVGQGTDAAEIERTWALLVRMISPVAVQKT